MHVFCLPQDHQAGRVGVLTTNDTKFAMAALTNTMLRERRLHFAKNLVSREAKKNMVRLREQMVDVLPIFIIRIY